MNAGYWKKEVPLSNGDVKVIVYKADVEKTIMYRDGKKIDMSAKLPLVVFGMDDEYEKISKEEAERIIKGME